LVARHSEQSGSSAQFERRSREATAVYLSGWGAAALPLSWPLAAQAEQLAKPHRLGYLALLPGENATFAKPLLQRLQEPGDHEGRNMVWDYRSADGQPGRLPQTGCRTRPSRPRRPYRGIWYACCEGFDCCDPEHTGRVHGRRRACSAPLAPSAGRSHREAKEAVPAWGAWGTCAGTALGRDAPGGGHPTVLIAAALQGSNSTAMPPGS
jgi:hypothetical protein